MGAMWLLITRWIKWVLFCFRFENSRLITTINPWSQCLGHERKTYFASLEKNHSKLYKQDFAESLTWPLSPEKQNLSLSTQISSHRVSKRSQQRPVSWACRIRRLYLCRGLPPLRMGLPFGRGWVPNICRCLPPDTTWHKVKSPKAN